MEEKVIKDYYYNFDGVPVPLNIVRSRYAMNGAMSLTAVVAEEVQEAGVYCGEVFGNLTINLMNSAELPSNQAYLSRDGHWKDFVNENGIGKIVGEGHSGFANYYLCEFTQDFLDNCEDATE